MVLASVSAFAHGKKSKGHDTGWEPESVQETLQPGQSLEIPVTYLPDENMFDVSVVVSPEIAAYVSVEPEAIEKVKKGKPISLTATINIPAAALPEVHSGLIQIVDEEEGKKNRNFVAGWQEFWAAHRKDKDRKYGKPLSLSLEIIWPRTENLPGGVSFSYPTFGQPAQIEIRQNGETISFHQVTTINEQPVVQYIVGILPNPGNLTLLDWFNQNVDLSGSIVASRVYEIEVLSNGIEVLDVTGEIPTAHLNCCGPIKNLYAILPSGSIVTIVSGHEHNFGLVGSSYQDIRSLYLELLRSLEIQSQ